MDGGKLHIRSANFDVRDPTLIHFSCADFRKHFSLERVVFIINVALIK